MLYLHTEDMVSPEIHDFLLDDQLTVDFMLQMNWLLKYFVRSAPAGFRLSASLINKEFLISKFLQNPLLLTEKFLFDNFFLHFLHSYLKNQLQD